MTRFQILDEAADELSRCAAALRALSRQAPSAATYPLTIALQQVTEAQAKIETAREHLE